MSIVTLLLFVYQILKIISLIHRFFLICVPNT